MKKLYQIVAGAITTVILMTLMAVPAQAFTRYGCEYRWRQIIWSTGAQYSWQLGCNYDYNWWEETFQGKRDGWYWDNPPTVRASVTTDYSVLIPA